jgi:hypothetical protein
MRRTLTAAVALLTCATVAAVPAQAAPKKKPKPIKGGYSLHLYPDPTANVLSLAEVPHTCGAGVPDSTHRFTFKVPAAGTLQVNLDAADPAPGTPFVFDWDIFVLDAADQVIGEGTSSESTEEIRLKLTKAQKVVFLTCNLNGQPDATVKYTFTYR